MSNHEKTMAILCKMTIGETLTDDERTVINDWQAANEQLLTDPFSEEGEYWIKQMVRIQQETPPSWEKFKRDNKIGSTIQK